MDGFASPPASARTVIGVKKRSNEGPQCAASRRRILDALTRIGFAGLRRPGDRDLLGFGAVLAVMAALMQQLALKGRR